MAFFGTFNGQILNCRSLKVYKPLRNPEVGQLLPADDSFLQDIECDIPQNGVEDHETQDTRPTM